MTETIVELERTPAVENLRSDSVEPQQRPMRILVISGVFPSRVEPSRGVFVKERVKAMATLPGCDIRVIAPIPWFPPFKRFSRWYKWSQYPNEEIYEGLTIYHPRYALPPKVGGYFHPRLMYPAARRIADRLRRDGFEFDAIDAHFVYPAGVVGAKLGRRYGVPVVMTGRGEDMLRFPDMPFKGKAIRWALKEAAHCVALSSEIADAMKNNGAADEKVTIIPNGVDIDKFRPLPQRECRETLGLPVDAKIILGVGDRQERKGFHILIDAMPEVLRAFPDTHAVIVGGPGRHGTDYTAEIEKRIAQHNLHDRVHLVGPQPHDDLPLWYNAADLFALLSSREGSPNVLLEALACGTPAVGTALGGIVDELARPEMGIVVKHRDFANVASAICTRLKACLDRNNSRNHFAKRSWQETANRQFDCIDSRGDGLTRER